MGTKQSNFTEITNLDDTKFVPVFGAGTNEKISKDNLFDQIKDETQIFIYPSVELLQSSDLIADPDWPVYVRVEETGYSLYKITSLAANVGDIELDNGTTATLQSVQSPSAAPPTVAVLATLSPSVGQLVITKGALAAGDGGHGAFIVEAASGTPDGYSRVLLASGYHAVLQRPWNVKQFGAQGNRVTNDTLAINRAMNAIRTISLTAEKQVSMTVPQGDYLVSSVNATQIRSKGWSLHCNGATFYSATPGSVVFDFLHSRGGTIYNLCAEGDETTPPMVGVQIGYMSGQVSASNMNFVGCYSLGSFTRTAFYNGGSEESTTSTGQWRNTNSSSSSYCYIADSSNFWRRTSAYAVGDQVTKNITGIAQANPAVVTVPNHTYTNGTRVTIADVSGMTEVNGLTFTVANATANTFQLSGIDSTAYGAYVSGGTVAKLKTESFVQVINDNVSFFKPNGGPVIWIGWSSDRHEFRKCYAYAGSGTPITIYMDPVESSGQYHQQLKLDVGIEGATVSTGVYFQRASAGAPAMSGFEFKDHGPQCTSQVFLANSPGGGQINLVGANIDIARLPSGLTSGWFNPTSEFNVTGVMSTRETTGIKGMPRKFKGSIYTQAADVGAYGVGSYEINAISMASGVNIDHAVFKGTERYIGGKSSTIADGALDTLKYMDVSSDGIEWSTDTGSAADASIKFGTNVMTIIVDGVTYARTATSITDPLAAIPTYADDAAAGAGGLTAGRRYKSSDGILRVKL